MRERLQAGWLLLQRDRAAEAEDEFRAAIAGDPGSSEAHAALAMSLVAQRKLEAALFEAKEAVKLGPDETRAHYVLAAVLDALDRLADAQASVREAIRLDPEDADARALLASLHLQRRDYADALEAAEAGLELDPEHGPCRNLRATALVRLGRRADAATAIEGAIQRDPEDADAFANAGWASLHRGQAKQALEQFREALRLRPGHEWARAGIVEALKARNFLYRGLLTWSLWMSRLSGRTQWVFTIGLYVMYRVVLSLRREHPEWAPVLTPLIVLYIAFWVLSWLGDPLFNLVLRLDRFGRHALSPEQRRASTVVGLLLLAGLLSVGAYFALHSVFFLVVAVYFGTMTIVVAAAMGAVGRRRVILATCAGVLALLGAVSLALPFFVADPMPLWIAYLIGFVIFQWIAVGTSIARPR